MPLRFFFLVLLGLHSHISQLNASQKNTPRKRKASIVTTAAVSSAITTEINQNGLDEQDRKALRHSLVQPKDYHPYHPQRKRNIYSSSSSSSHETIFPLSRSKVEKYLQCGACFYMDRKLGLEDLPSIPFSLNIAVDNNMKNEFDVHREHQTEHPYCTAYDAMAREKGLRLLNAVPFKHPRMDEWRNSRSQGLRYKIPGTNLELYGGVDDIWINTVTGELYIVDYKATSKQGKITIDASWQDSYKRQMTIYQYLLRKVLEAEGYKVSNIGIFVYANAQAGTNTFDNKLNFETTLRFYEGDDSWVEPLLRKIYQDLQSDKIPASSQFCAKCKQFSYELHLRRTHEIQMPTDNQSGNEVAIKEETIIV